MFCSSNWFASSQATGGRSVMNENGCPHKFAIQQSLLSHNRFLPIEQKKKKSHQHAKYFA